MGKSGHLPTLVRRLFPHRRICAMMTVLRCRSTLIRKMGKSGHLCALVHTYKEDGAVWAFL
eukprot:15054489-Ditylum_brightwellii.AAC.1